MGAKILKIICINNYTPYIGQNFLQYPQKEAMHIFTKISEYKAWRRSISSSHSVGFVPTMGALHEGHGSLIQRSVEENDYTVLSIFVNPTQFAPTDDLDAYPRTFDADRALAEKLGAAAIFFPQAQEIYPQKQTFIRFEIDVLDQVMETASRPGHMNGVLQVVSILFHIIQPDRAYFGLKDFQQQLIVKKMVEELCFPLEIVACPIVREIDGLAMSSRNTYLNNLERKQAVSLFEAIQIVQKNWPSYTHSHEAVEAAIAHISQQSEAKIDYVEIREAESLASIERITEAQRPHIFLAVYVGTTRLIDNMTLPS